jgi:hypothetical protein
MKNKIFIILIFLMFCNCESTKSIFRKKDKTESNKETKETGLISSKRDGDTLKYVLPNIKYKDTTIYVKDYKNPNSNTLRIKYDNAGNQKAIDCISNEINDLKSYIIETKENEKKHVKTSDKDKQTVFSSLNILYIFIGLAFLLVVYKKV